MEYPRKYRKKPVEIEAILFTGNNWYRVKQFVGQITIFDMDAGEDREVWGFQSAGPYANGVVAMVGDRLHNTWVGVKAGQWIIKGVQGEFYPCDPDVFESTYDDLDARPCRGENPDICVAEGCYDEACIGKEV